jgi:Na+/alanine symporter
VEAAAVAAVTAESIPALALVSVVDVTVDIVVCCFTAVVQLLSAPVVAAELDGFSPTQPHTHTHVSDHVTALHSTHSNQEPIG